MMRGWKDGRYTYIEETERDTVYTAIYKACTDPIHSRKSTGGNMEEV